MENPVSIVKSNLSVAKIVGFVVVGLAVFAILDAAKVTNWLLFPVTTAKAKFGKGSN
jgi:hypothetical protein